MSERHTFPQSQLQGSKGVQSQPALPISDAHRGPTIRSIHRLIWLLLGFVLVGVVSLMILSYHSIAVCSCSADMLVSALAGYGLCRVSTAIPQWMFMVMSWSSNTTLAE